MGVMRIPDQTGHTDHRWDPDDADSVEIAEKMFDDMKKKGYLAYTLDKEGKKGALIASFNKDLAVIHYAKKVVGG